MSNDAFYEEIIEEVLPLLEEYGTTFTVRSIGVYDPKTLSTSIPDPRNVIGVNAGAFVASELGSDVGGANKGGPINVGSQTIIVEPSAALLPTDEIQVNGTWHSCSKLVTVQPGNIVVIYMVTISG